MAGNRRPVAPAVRLVAALAWVTCLAACVPRATLPSTTAGSLPWLSARGTSIVDERGTPVVLRGCNLGGWLELEMWLLDQPDLADQQAAVDLLTERFGPRDAQRLLDTYREHFITERDFDTLRAFDFNVVRVPFDYRLLEDDARPMTLRPEAFRWLDRAVDLASRAGFYTILDLHGAPGGQSIDHCTGQAGQNRLWQEPALQDRTVWLWRQIASHFAGAPAVAGYDLLNEPFGDYHTTNHLAALRDLTDRMYEAVRAVDPRHLVFVGAPQQGLAALGNDAARGWTNVVFTEHDYPGLHGQHEALETHARFISQRLPEREAWLKQTQAPFLVGEYNVVLSRLGAPWLTRRYADEYARRGWAATLWTCKRIQRASPAGADPWHLLANRDPLPSLDFRRAGKDELEALFRSLDALAYVTNDGLRRALTARTPIPVTLASYPPRLVEPPADDPVPHWSATDIGGALPGGQRVRAPDAVDVFGGGRDIWKDADQFRYLWTRGGSDLELEATVTALAETSPHAKAGLMWRADLEPDAPHVLLHVFPDGHLMLGWRAQRGGAMQERSLWLGALPVMLRLRHAGAAIEAAWSYDGTRWSTAEAPVSAAYAEEGLLGLATLAHDNNTSLTTASFTGLNIRPRTPPP